MGSKLNELLNRKAKDNPRVTAYVSQEMFQVFKMFCKKNDITMSECIEALIADALQDARKVVPISSVPRRLSGEDSEE